LIEVPGGALGSTVCPGGVCRPGIYYAQGADPVCGNTATGDPLGISGNLSFNGGAFGQFAIFGGLKIGQNSADFGPGQCILAGTKSPSTMTPDVSNKALTAGGHGCDAGRIFILMDSNNPGLSQCVNLIERRSDRGTRSGARGAGTVLLLSAHNRPTYRPGNSLRT